MTELIAAVWRDVLGTGRIDDATDFFDVGGHSLAAVKIVSRIEAEYDVDVPVHLLFDHSTFGEFTLAIEELLDTVEGAA